jgi:hypothetical protein
MRCIAYLRGAVLLLAAAFLLSGCAVLSKQELKPAAPTLTHGRLVYLANRACRRFVRRVKRHKPRIVPGEPRQNYEAILADFQHVYLPATDKLLFDLHGLAPSPADADHYRLMLATLNDEDLVIHNFFQAIDEIQLQRAKTLVRRVDRLGKRLDARAAKVGLKSCGKS